MHQRTTKTASPHFVTALARGLEVLRCFDRPGLELTVSEIARRIGLSQPTTWRLCQTLLDCGYLVRSPNGAALRVGAASVTLGYAAVSGAAPVDLALPHMRAITEEFDVTTSIGKRQGQDMIAMDMVKGRFVRPDQPIGWRAPLPSNASGLAVLAALPAHARDAAMASVSGDDDARARRTTRLAAALEEYERKGFVSMRHSRRGTYIAIAVPLFEDGTDPMDQWAINCSWVAEHEIDAIIDDAGHRLGEIRRLLQPAIAVLSDQAALSQ